MTEKTVLIEIIDKLLEGATVKELRILLQFAKNLIK